MSRKILIASGKGGVGKTVFTSNVASVLAERGLKTLMIDMNLGLRNLDLYMGLENKVVFDIADVVNGVVGPSKALVRDKRFPYLYLLAATQKKDKLLAGSDSIKKLYDDYSKVFDVILIDGPAGINDELKLASSGVDLAVLIATPEYVSLRDADAVASLLSEKGLKNRTYVINKVNKANMRSGLLPTFEEISSLMRIPLLGIVQSDNIIHLSANAGKPVVMQRGSYIEKNFANIVDRMLYF